MKIMMNKIILIIVIVSSYSNVFSQSEAKNAVRIGAGVNFSDHVSGEKYSMGYALEAEYQRSLSKHIGITANLSTHSLHYGETHDISDISFAIGTMITPFPDRFRFIKIGTGVGYRHFINSWGTTLRSDDIIYYFRHSGNVIGLDFVGRLYCIDNSKYELFASYRLKTSFDHGIEMNNALLCLCFGVKF